MNILFTVILMIFCHILDDFVIQGKMADLKQKGWWQEHTEDCKYRFDYIPALLAHSFSWSFMVMLPVAAYLRFNIPISFVVCLIANAVLHAFVDDLKANKSKINLIADQSFHLVQIAITAALFLV